MSVRWQQALLKFEERRDQVRSEIEAIEQINLATGLGYVAEQQAMLANLREILRCYEENVRKAGIMAEAEAERS